MEPYGNDYPYLPTAVAQQHPQQPQIVTNHYTGGTLSRNPQIHQHPYAQTEPEWEYPAYSPQLPPPPPDYDTHQHQRLFSPDLGFNSPLHIQQQNVNNIHHQQQHHHPHHPGSNYSTYSNGGQAYFSSGNAPGGANSVVRVNPCQEAIVRQLQEKFGEDAGSPVVVVSNGGNNHLNAGNQSVNGTNGRSNGGPNSNNANCATTNGGGDGGTLCCEEEGGGGCIIPYSKLPLLLLLILFLLTLFLSFSGALLYFKCK
ncbi:hypothetical protein Fcan01_13552 [Folsomia candida]|uniref:Uncharacterized protein n=1 Tax=Folsomia candida TaxID=158441 RepID=A0A226E0R8_FOLCA|nr:hypothetical protein Fcan01_13552 [Folsomia candida]